MSDLTGLVLIIAIFTVILVFGALRIHYKRITSNKRNVKGIREDINDIWDRLNDNDELTTSMIDDILGIDKRTCPHDELIFRDYKTASAAGPNNFGYVFCQNCGKMIQEFKTKKEWEEYAVSAILGEGKPEELSLELLNKRIKRISNLTKNNRKLAEGIIEDNAKGINIDGFIVEKLKKFEETIGMMVSRAQVDRNKLNDAVADITKLNKLFKKLR